MAWTKYQILLATTLVITGSINTLSTKWADNLHSNGSDGVSREFDHPFVQACAMFLGEMLCLFVFKIIYYILDRRQDGSVDTNEFVKGNRNFSPLILFIPAMCDMIATSTMYVGLNLTYASSFQMFRGSVIIFVSILSVAFLNRVLKIREWIGIWLVIMGLTVVGATDFFFTNTSTYSKNAVLTGDLLIITAQIITAIQMVYEEKFVKDLDIPALQAVGWEGFFGFMVLVLLQIPFYFIKVGSPFNNNAHGTLEDLPDAFVQIANNYQLLIAVLGMIVSIAFFNFAGISVTKELSATTRMVLDSVRTVVIWVVALAVKWQLFYWPQIIGFSCLIFGMCLYNNIFILQSYYYIRDVCRNSRYGKLQSQDVTNVAADNPDVA
ncbi:solute carrier family 35 member F6-like isoform X1 [Ctenocephalides felis]|uniref:solute carrier family 35 member F6-like isoform X1 n=2 Tax=Ctenocephalides felis TaxID=7515 RepID=UPI000E6E4B31|nr:solute carrier family 35 member F6-like isoform X1 [Ctenocephalides felis]XP_026472162.1 solute carrier family 35 member F6-like isoform X1 [Ctenocephalides felis]